VPHIPAVLYVRPVTESADTRKLYGLYRQAVLAVQVCGTLRYCKFSVVLLFRTSQFLINEQRIEEHFHTFQK
jgi:hypothetical protein